MTQTPGFDPTTQVKTYFDCKMFDVANWVACLNRAYGKVQTFILMTAVSNSLQMPQTKAGALT